MKSLLKLVVFCCIFLCTTAYSQNPSANLDQCANGVINASQSCNGNAWINGNLNSNKSHYQEGQFIPYRLRFNNLNSNSVNTVTIEYDTTQNGKHALDYLGSFDATESNANPCSGVNNCSSSNSFIIPKDNKVLNGLDGIANTVDDINQLDGSFSMFGGLITNVSSYQLSGDYNGSSKTRIVLTFTAFNQNPVLSWSGHISTRKDWGISNSAIAISGSPYHTRLTDLNGNGGNQDRSLTADAVIFPAQITVIKEANPKSSTDFNFTTTGLTPSSFILDDDNDVDLTYSNNIIFNNINTFGVENPKTVTEIVDPSTRYQLVNINCIESSGGGTSIKNTTVDLFTGTANIIAEEGEFITCTFVNQLPTASVVSLQGRVLTSNNLAVKRALVTITNSFTGETLTTQTNQFGFYKFDNLTVNSYYILDAKAKGYTFNQELIYVIDSTSKNLIAN